MSFHPQQTDQQKRETLAQTIGVTPDRLVTLSGTTCRRINTAIKRYPLQAELSWRELIRTPGLGHRSASELCEALNLPKTLIPPAIPEVTDQSDKANRVAEQIANVINSNPATSEHYRVIKNEGPCPSFVLVDHEGIQFRVRVDRML